MRQTAALIRKNYKAVSFASPLNEQFGSPARFDSPAIENDFPDIIDQVIKFCFCDGQVEITAVARIVDVSVRTLQRKLAMAGLTYSDLVRHARYEAAVQELQNSNTRIIDIAYDLGYVDPSNFSRAFRRMAGTSPLQFRLTCQES